MGDNQVRAEAITGRLNVLRQLNPYEFAVEVAIMRSGLNNNKWDYRNIEKHYLTFLGQPILIAYVGNKIGDGHNMRIIRMPDGGQEYTFVDGTAERIIGVLSDDEKEFRLEERDGNMWIIAKGRIFRFYAREAVDKIVATGAMDVSAETEIYDGVTESNGVEVFENWAGLGVTILGDDVPPAIPGAHIRAMSVREDVEGMKLRAASLLREADKTPSEPKRKGVNRRMNKREFALLQEKFTGYTVLAASDDGMNVCLLSEKDGVPAGYTFSGEADKNGVVEERIVPMRVNASFAFDEEHSVDVDIAQITESLNAKLNAANSDIEAKDKEIARLNEVVEEMKKNEMARRIVDAKKAVMNRLDALNKDRDERCAYSKDLADALCAKIETGCFNTVCNEKGEWCGDEYAVMELEAKCAREQEKMDKANADKAKKAVSWNTMSLGGEHPESDAEALLAWVTK